jgi:hypothetical protein
VRGSKFLLVVMVFAVIAAAASAAPATRLVISGSFHDERADSRRSGRGLRLSAGPHLDL